MRHLSFCTPAAHGRPQWKDVMSWKQLPDGKDKLEAFLREVQENDAAQRPTDPSTRTPSRKRRRGWILVLALVVVAVWLLW